MVNHVTPCTQTSHEVRGNTVQRYVLEKGVFVPCLSESVPLVVYRGPLVVYQDFHVDFHIALTELGSKWNDLSMVYRHGILFLNIPLFIKLFSTTCEISPENLILAHRFFPSTFALVVAWKFNVVLEEMAFFLKRYSMRKHLATLRIFNYIQGWRKKLLSVDIPLGVHRPLGVPTPVYPHSAMMISAVNLI